MSSYGLINLKMLSNYAGRLLELIDNLDFWHDTLSEKWKAAKVGEVQKACDDEENYVSWKKYLQDSLSLCNELNLKAAPTRLSLFLDEFSLDMPTARCFLCLKEIRDLIEADLRDINFESISPLKIFFYDHSLGEEPVAQAFPTAVADLKEAGTCYALNRNTACAFHVIRALEIALRSLAKCSGVKVTGKTTPLEYQQWNNIIEAIEAQSKKNYGQMKPGPIKENALNFYSACLSDFIFFKNAVRNILLHNRTGLYNAPEALGVLFRAKDCLLRMAHKISEHRSKKLTPLDFK